MESRNLKSNRHRSLGIDLTSHHVHQRRASAAERHKSAPSIGKIHPSQPYQNDALLASDQRSTETTVRDNRPIINLAVLGRSRVGKTSFIQNAFNLESPPFEPFTSRNVSLGGVIHRVALYEVDLGLVEILDDQHVNWPKKVGNVVLPMVDAALCLYDITNEDSIAGIPQILHVLERLRTPATLVACKADAPISEQEVGIAFVGRVRRSFPSIIFVENSFNSADSAKRCLTIALKLYSAASQSNNQIGEIAEEDEQPTRKSILELDTRHLDLCSAMPTAPQTPNSETDPSARYVHVAMDRPGLVVPATPESYYNSTTAELAAQNTGNKNHSHKTFLQTEDDSSDESTDQVEKGLQKLQMQPVSRHEIGEGGTPFLKLVDRLLSMPTSKNDAKFVPAFLCLYRAFATAEDLLLSITDRFSQTSQSALVQFVKLAELLRYLQVLAQWTATYPGDFADHHIRDIATIFVRDLERQKSFAPAAREILGNLQKFVEDEDQDWAFDESYEQDDLKTKRISGLSAPGSRKGSYYDADSDCSDDDFGGPNEFSRHSGSRSTVSSIARSSVPSNQSATNVHTIDGAREQAKKLRIIPQIRLTKVHWHQFMDTPTEELAREITRIDWVMFSAIRPRDFVRHVSVSSRMRAHNSHSDMIGMMVKHFNHLALFVSGMILIRDKPKHRAKMLEKFMDLAWKVRQLNNYNSLGAIVAGITGPEIARLAQTHELIAPETQKQFWRLTILMSISKSHSAYRMAWENSFNERIPFVPLVRQDLTMASSANQTFIGNNINWKKFEIMGDVIIGIQRSHEQPYAFPEKTQKSREIIRLILETKIIDESEESADPRSELYDRSVQIESSAAGEGRKKFDWLWR